MLENVTSVFVLTLQNYITLYKKKFLSNLYKRQMSVNIMKTIFEIYFVSE